MNNWKVLLVLLFLGGVLWFTFQKAPLPCRPIFLSKPRTIKAPVSDSEAIRVAKAINARNQKIHNILYPKMEIRLSEGIISSVKGFLAYEKPKRFKMTTQSIFGQETDIGSNDQEFWFWSKRLRPPSIYYSNYEEAGMSRLKTPFHPIWIREGMSLETIELEGVGVSLAGDNYLISQKRIALNGREVTKATLIDREKIIGHYLYDSTGTLISSIEITEFYYLGGHIVPKKCLIIWAEENASMEWRLEIPQINIQMMDTMWTIPSHHHRQNLSDRTTYRTAF